MKAVLVIDGIPDDFSIDNLCAYFKLLNYSDGNMKEVGLEGKIKLEPYKEAISKEWIVDWLTKQHIPASHTCDDYYAVEMMLEDWEKENETN